MLAEEIMEEILSEIQTIKWLLFILIAIFGLIALGVLFSIYKMTSQLKKGNPFEDFSSEARNLLDKGMPDEVIEKAISRIESYPKDKYAYWYLAQAYQDKEEYSQALETFSALKKIAPLWEKQYVEPSIKKIKEILKNTKPELL